MTAFTTALMVAASLYSPVHMGDNEVQNSGTVIEVGGACGGTVEPTDLCNS